MLCIYQDEYHQWKPMYTFVVIEVMVILYFFILFCQGYPLYVVGLYAFPVLIGVFLERYKLHIYKHTEVYEHNDSLSFQILFLKLSNLTLSLFAFPIAVVRQSGYLTFTDEMYMAFIYIYFIQLFCVWIGGTLSYICEVINVERQKKKQATWLMGIGTALVVLILIVLPIIWIARLTLFVYFCLGFIIGDAFYKSRKISREGET